ncbi:MAG: hypothetical protein U0V56_09815 [Actinomycetota bacterium]
MQGQEHAERHGRGALGFLLGGFMVVSFLFVKDLGLAAFSDDALPYWIVGTAAFELVVYLIVKSVQRSKGIKVEYAFREIPPE